MRYREEKYLCWRGDFLVKRKTKRKRIRKKVKVKPAEINLAYVLLAVALVIILVWGMTLFTLGQKGIIPVTQDGESGAQETTDTFTCEINRECFMVGCKSKTITECVNATEVDFYYRNCEAWYDVRVEKQDFSECACVNGFCKKQ